MASKKSSLPAVDELTEKIMKTEYARLADEIAGHDRRYHQEDAPTVTDAEYDELRRRSAAIEARPFRSLAIGGSLSLRVGAAPSPPFAEQAARGADAPCLTTPSPKRTWWICRLDPPLPALAWSQETCLWREPKIDGLSMSLRYGDGKARYRRDAATAPRARTSPPTRRRLKTFQSCSKARMFQRSAKCAAKST